MRDAVLVRVYGRKTELIVDRANELRNFQVLQDHGCAPKLYCTFENGYCYEFMPGKALGPEHVRQPQIFRYVEQDRVVYGVPLSPINRFDLISGVSHSEITPGSGSLGEVLPAKRKSPVLENSLAVGLFSC